MPLLGQDFSGALNRRVTILGPGLIGGSLAMALRRGGRFQDVSIWARREEAALEAASLLPGCHVSHDLATAVAESDIAVLCLSPHAIEAIGPELVKHLPRHAIVTDAGSVKGKIVTRLEEVFGGRFIGAHPMAGSEQSGIRAARENLYDGAVCILTPTAHTDPAARDLAAELWTTAGCALQEMSPEAHDRAMARISHLPHAAAAALVHAALGANPSLARLAGGGYRDSTRIAGGPEGLWAEIFLDNSAEVLNGIHDLQTALETLKLGLESGNRSAVEAFLADARTLRASQPPAT
ncbi:MAG: prephenate dehydrogenase [Spartobacteria bacterium]